MNESDEWGFGGGNTRLDLVCIEGRILVPGDKVRLLPQVGADAIDLLLAGRVAVIEGIECDVEDRIYLAVVIDDDPGKEFGMMRQPGHRFFYSPNEVEPWDEGPAKDATAHQ